ncbi:cation-translocating P-type ATPase [Caproiciproducens sp. R2]|uniref:cation-translocating P-type ATPase n=1 Tax=Caproiciproducens sp. R2 TaxID=3435187 RepID=UPI004033DFA5
MAEKLWYSESIQETCKVLYTDKENGLRTEQVGSLREKYGPNELAQKSGTTIFEMLLEQFKDYLVIILIIASIVSIAVGEITDSIVIIGIVIVNACLGVFQEYRAGKALEALKKMSAPNAKVIREGCLKTVPAQELVPGDLVVLETGDYIPADVRITESVNLKADESALTGESVPVDKDASALLEGEVALGDQVNRGFMSTIVTYGRGKGVVTATGMNTVIGGIAGMIQDAEEEATPLQKKLAQMGKFLGTGCLAICALVFVMGLLRGEQLLSMFMTAVSLAVAAIPEGLPAVVTIVLALGMQRMVKHHAIMKKLHAVETLGSTTVICSDKTGTLTQNQMTIVKMFVPGAEIDVTGEGYTPQGGFLIGEQEMELSTEPAVSRLLEIGVLCNDASLEKECCPEEKDQWKILGDPTEGALVVAAAKAGKNRGSMNTAHPRLQEIPFDSGRKLMTTFHRDGEGRVVAYTKGAPDILVGLCSRIMRRDGRIEEMTEGDRKEILDENRRLARSALRVLGMSFKPMEKIPDHPTPQADEKDMVFTGLVGMIDPPRVEAIQAIKVCKSAGIRAVMITGDYRDTAAAVAKKLGIVASDDQVLTGAELSGMDDAELKEAVKTVGVFARVSPEHKVRIVQAVRDNGGIAAMTGDGVNDAPALKRADIGIAMGITGTDVAKETADMILTDDNFASIVSAVEEGRVIYSNIRKFVFFLMSCNIGEILIVFLSMLFQWPIPLLPIHLLWVNLVTDAFPALALGTEKKEPGIMQDPPRNPEEPIINRNMIINIVVQSLVMTAAVLGSFYFGWHFYNLETGRTYAFVTITTCELLRAYTCRSEKFTLLKIGIFSNRYMNLATIVSFVLMAVVILLPGLRTVFNVVPFNWQDWDFVILVAFLPVVFGELTKAVKSRGKKTAVESLSSCQR